MRRSALFSLLATGVVAAAGLLPAACDSTLNLSAGEAGVTANAEGGGPGEGDASCPGVCDKLIACSFGQRDKRELCISDCVQQAPQPLRECIARTSCSELQRACAGELPEVSIPIFDSSVFDNETEIENCQSACDSVKFFDCLTAAEYATCRDLCASAPASRRNTFKSCASGPASNCPNAQDCFRVFVGD